MNQIMGISVLRMKTVSKQQILVTLTLWVTWTRMQMLVWTGNNGRRYAWYALTSSASSNTDIWNAVVVSRNAIQFRILRDCTRKGEVAPKLTLLLNAINRLMARKFTGDSLHWRFGILVAEVLPHCEASKTQLRILQKSEILSTQSRHSSWPCNWLQISSLKAQQGLTIEHAKQVITDREKEIARKPKKVQFEEETAYTMGPVPALAANNGNIPSSEQSGSAALLNKQNFDLAANNGNIPSSEQSGAATL
jgi:hypothetical protein